MLLGILVRQEVFINGDSTPLTYVTHVECYLGLNEPADVSVAPGALGQQAENRRQALLIVGPLLMTGHSTPTHILPTMGML